MRRPWDPGEGRELSSDEKREQLKRLLEPRAAAGKDGPFPLSYGQQALWFIYRSDPESPAYNWIYQERARQSIDITPLRRAIRLLMDRHEQLRVQFSEQEDGFRQQVKPIDELPFDSLDVSDWTQTQLDSEILKETSRPFDLVRGPVIRFRLYRRSDDDCLLLIVAHHIVMDRRSITVLMEELTAFYSSRRVAGKPALAVPESDSYQEYVSWERLILEGPEGKELARYWRKQLAGAPTALDLPTDYPRPEIQRFVGASHQFAFPDELTARLADLAREERTSLFVVILASLDILLWRYTGQDDVLIGTPMATRNRVGFERTVGYFVNSVVLRGRLSAALTVRELIRQVRGTVIEALEHQDYPFALLVEKLHPHRDPGRSPIFQVMLNWNKVEPANDQSAPDDLDNSNSGTIAYPQQQGIFDLHLEISETAGPLAVILNYDTALFRPETIKRLAGHLESLLRGMASNPEQRVGAVSLLTAEELQEITIGWNETQVGFSRTLKLEDLIERQVESTPDAVAAGCDGRELTYGELNCRANQLAGHLRALGAGPGSKVAFCIDRSVEMLAVVVGILKTGATYVPLDPSYPAARLSYMLEDADATVLVTSDSLTETLSYDGQVVLLDTDRSEIERQSDQNPPRFGSAEDLAYIIYTSGSTGKPKGVGVRHRNVVNFLESMRERPGLTSQDRWLAVASISFDMSVLDVYLPLIVGARLELASSDLAADGPRLLERVRSSRATVMQATPTTWQMMIASGWDERLGLRVLSGGEALTPALAQSLIGRSVEVWNLYGPTETTVYSSILKVDEPEPVITVGRPIANTQLYVLDDRLEPVPIGVTGELCIGGEGVTTGYINLPDQTAARFVPDPFSAEEDAQMYRTGDLARYREDGEVEVLGRVDHQVKLRGFRIELGEIESSLRREESIREALVSLREDDPGSPMLVAYLIPEHPEEKPSATELIGSLRKSLPQYMIPAHYVWLERFPLAPNGKIDRMALPKPEDIPRVLSRPRDPSVSVTESMLMEIWRDVLGLAEIGVYDTFFDLGGHSLLSLQVVDRVETATGVRLNPAELVNQTVRQIAARLDEMAQRGSTPESARQPGRILDVLKSGLFGTGSET